MIAAAEIGNSRVHAALYEGETQLASFCWATNRKTTEDEWTLALTRFCADRGIDPKSAEGGVIGSVVPGLTPVLCGAFQRVFGKRPRTVGHGIRTGLDIRTERQAELGADIAANAVGARGKSAGPLIVADLGTATTVFAVDENDRFLGVSILPGLYASADALADTCDNLPRVALTAPKGLLGKTTADSVAGGLICGFAALLDGVVDRITEEYGFTAPALFLCGGGAKPVLPHCRRPFRYEPDLTLDGLARLYALNRPKER